GLTQHSRCESQVESGPRLRRAGFRRHDALKFLAALQQQAACLQKNIAPCVRTELGPCAKGRCSGLHGSLRVIQTRRRRASDQLASHGVTPLEHPAVRRVRILVIDDERGFHPWSSPSSEAALAYRILASKEN